MVPFSSAKGKAALFTDVFVGQYTYLPLKGKMSF